MFAANSPTSLSQKHCVRCNLCCSDDNKRADNPGRPCSQRAKYRGLSVWVSPRTRDCRSKIGKVLGKPGQAWHPKCPRAVLWHTRTGLFQTLLVPLWLSVRVCPTLADKRARLRHVVGSAFQALSCWCFRPAPADPVLVCWRPPRCPSACLDTSFPMGSPPCARMRCEGALEPHEPLTLTGEERAGRQTRNEAAGSGASRLPCEWPDAVRLLGPRSSERVGQGCPEARHGADGTQRLSQDTAQKKQKCQVPEMPLQEQNKKTKFRRPFFR